jgi:hypothetical protein
MLVAVLSTIIDISIVAIFFDLPNTKIYAALQLMFCNKGTACRK